MSRELSTDAGYIKKPPYEKEQGFIGDIKTGPYTISVEEVKDLYDSKGEDLYGASNKSSLTVVVATKGIHPTVRKTTLFHELGHIVVGLCGKAGLDFDEGTEEAYVEALTSGLFSILAENPHLVEYLFGPAMNNKIKSKTK